MITKGKSKGNSNEIRLIRRCLKFFRSISHNILNECIFFEKRSILVVRSYVVSQDLSQEEGNYNKLQIIESYQQIS